MQPSWQDPGSPPSMPQMVLPRLTPATRRLLILNGAIFLFSFLLYFFADDLHAALVHRLALSPLAWRTAFPFVPVWQLLTYGFLHAVNDPGHIVGNMLMLYFFGTMLEELIGSRRFLFTYLSAQLVGALFFLLPGVFSPSAAQAMGASGAVYGIMIATATLRPRQSVFLFFIPITLQILALGIVGMTLFGAMLSLKNGSDGIAHMVHLGGIAYGFLAVRTGLIAKDPIEIFQRRRAVAQVERQGADEDRMDQLLEKISRDGMASLSRGEREFLRRVSSRK